MPLPTHRTCVEGDADAGGEMTRREIWDKHEQDGLSPSRLVDLLEMTTALTPEQRQQMVTLTKNIAARVLKTGQSYASAMDAVSTAKSSKDSHEIRTKLLHDELNATGTELGLSTKPTADELLKKYGGG
jgi:hypothetical protein